MFDKQKILDSISELLPDKIITVSDNIIKGKVESLSVRVGPELITYITCTPSEENLLRIRSYGMTLEEWVVRGIVKHHLNKTI